MGKLFNHSKNALKIAEICLDSGLEIPFHPNEARIYSNCRLSWHDRAAGTWRWHFWHKDSPVFIGSNVRVSDLIKAKKFEFIEEPFGIEIFPIYQSPTTLTPKD